MRGIVKNLPVLNFLFKNHKFLFDLLLSYHLHHRILSAEKHTYDDKYNEASKAMVIRCRCPVSLSTLEFECNAGRLTLTFDPGAGGGPAGDAPCIQQSRVRTCLGSCDLISESMYSGQDIQHMIH